VSSFAPPASAQPVEEGTLLGERYFLETFLGAGHTGRIFLARDIHTSRICALKIFHPWLARDARSIETFTYGFMRMKRLQLPGIVQVHTMERDAAHHVWFLVMEHIAGNSLQQELDERQQDKVTTPPFSIQDILFLFEQLVGILQFLHRKRIVHRDLKPSHILWDSAEADRRIKLIGFGMSASSSEFCGSSIHLGEAGVSFYTAPERMKEGVKATPSTDIFSLGVILYEMLTGALPIGMAEMPSSLFPELPSELDHILRKALQPRAKDRYQNVQTFWEELQVVLEPFRDTPYLSHKDQGQRTILPVYETRNHEAKLSPVAVSRLVPHDEPVTDSCQAIEATLVEIDCINDNRPATHQELPQFAASPTPEASIDMSLPHVPDSIDMSSRRQPRHIPQSSFASVPPRIVQRSDERKSAQPSAQPTQVMSNTDRLHKLRRHYTERVGQYQTVSPIVPSNVPKPPRSLSFQTDQRDLTALAFSPDGCFLASAAVDGTIKLWEVPSWYLLHTIEPGRSAIRHLAWSPEGNWLAMSDDEQQVSIRDVMNPTKTHSFFLHAPCTALAWSEDGRFLWASAADGTVTVWEASSIFIPQQMPLHEGAVLSLQSVPEGLFSSSQGQQMISSGADGAILLWESGHPTPLYQFHEDGTTPNVVTLHPREALLISGTTRGDIQFWEPLFEGQTRSWHAHEHAIQHILPHHDGSWFLTSDGGSDIHMWRTQDGEQLTTFSIDLPRLQGISLSFDSRWLAVVDANHFIKLIDISAWC
jgi:serine/threonine protein kinase